MKVLGAIGIILTAASALRRCHTLKFIDRDFYAVKQFTCIIIPLYGPKPLHCINNLLLFCSYIISVMDTNDRFLRSITIGQGPQEKGKTRQVRTVYPKIIKIWTPGLGCSKLTTSLVNISLNFQKLMSQIYWYFLLKKCEKLLSFFLPKISVYLVIKS